MSVLVDTSIWVDHLSTGNAELTAVLGRTRVVMHPWVLGQLALGCVTRNREVSTLLGPQAPVASEDELRDFIEARALHGRGIKCVDAQRG